MSCDINLEDRKARNCAWMEFAKQTEKPMEDIYLKVDENYQRILSIAGNAITTIVLGQVHPHPVDGAEIVRWSALPEVARQLAWMPDKPAAETSFD